MKALPLGWAAIGRGRNLRYEKINGWLIRKSTGLLAGDFWVTVSPKGRVKWFNKIDAAFRHVLRYER